MDKEQLVAMGLTNEQVDKVIKAHKKDLDGKYVPKERFNAVNEQVKTANQTIEDRDNQIEKLKAFEGTNEELQKEITKLQGENATEKKKHEDELNALQKTQMLKEGIASQKRKPYNVDDVLGKLDETKIQVNEGQLIGFQEQYDQVVKDKPYWFKPEQQDRGQDGLFGISFKGQQPPEGNNDNDSGLNRQEMFGKALANTVGTTDTAKNAMDYFFGKK